MHDDGACFLRRSRAAPTRCGPLNHQVTPPRTRHARKRCPIRTGGENRRAIATGLRRTQTFPFKSGCAAIATVPLNSPTCFPLVGRHF